MTPLAPERPTMMRFMPLPRSVVVAPGDVGIIFPPVSYTHLRAHETVLDLVCRLLLEKKTTHRSHDNAHDNDYKREIRHMN